MPYRSSSTATTPYDHLPGFGPMGSGILRALHGYPGLLIFFGAKHCARDLRAHVVKGRPQGGSGRNSGNTASLEVGQKNWHARGRWLCRSENGQSWERTDSVNTPRYTTYGNFWVTQYGNRPNSGYMRPEQDSIVRTYAN